MCTQEDKKKQKNISYQTGIRESSINMNKKSSF